MDTQVMDGGGIRSISGGGGTDGMVDGTRTAISPAPSRWGTPRGDFPGTWLGRPSRPIPRPRADAEVADHTQLRLWRPFPRARLDVICEEITAREVAVHAHEEVQISLPLAPFRMVDALGRTEMAGPGCIVLVNPAELHGAVPAGEEPWSSRVLLVGAETLARSWARRSGQAEDGRTEAPWFPRRVVSDPALAAELHALFEALRRPLTDVECEARLLDCLARLVERHGEPRPRPVSSPRYRWGVHRVRDYLREHVEEPVSIDQLARVALLSKHYLVRAFGREFGIPPHAYQMELRLARARTLLARGTPAAQAAYAAGFADQSHLTRRMRAAFGFTPAAYARQFATPRAQARGAAAPAIPGGLEAAA